jgi:outer membrane receptor protein involved in Fe transport
MKPLMSACALLFALSLSARPAEPPKPVSAPADESQPSASETIVVTATRSERAVSELPVSATVIRSEEIRSAPVRSVDDLVRTIPGVQMTIISGSGSTPNNQRVSMHGLGGTRALVLLDGIPIHDPYSGIVQWQKVPLDSLRQIEVVRGGNASLFGNFALGGTINLITRPVSGDGGAADLSYGTGNTGRAAVTLDQRLTERVSLRVSHNQNDSDGFVRVPDAGPVDVAAWIESTITAARADVLLSDRSAAFINASVSKFDISQGTLSTYSKRDIVATSGGLHRGTGNSGLLSANAFYQRQSERLVNSTLIGARESEFVSQDGTIPSTSAGASLEWSVQRSGVIPFLSVGVDLQQNEAAEERVTFNRGGAVMQLNQVGGRQRFAGLFAQTSWRPSDRLEVLVSARFDTFRSDEGRDIITGGLATYYPATTSKQLDPRVSVRYGIGSRSAVRASVYRAFNAPTLRDLYRKNQSGNTLILGNPYLQPETLVGGEVGWEWATGRSHVEVNVYRSTIDGMQARAHPAGQPTNVQQQFNLGSGRSQGVELIGDLRLSRQWSVNAGYTYADAIIAADPNPELIGNMLPEVPAHIGSLSVRYRNDRGTSADLRGRVVGRSYAEAANAAVSPAHRVVDVSISQRLRSSVELYALVENLLDEHYYLALAVNSFRSGLPRTVTTGIRLQWGRD